MKHMMKASALNSRIRMKAMVTPDMIRMMMRLNITATLLPSLSTMKPMKKHPSTWPTPKRTIASIEYLNYSWLSVPPIETLSISTKFPEK